MCAWNSLQIFYKFQLIIQFVNFSFGFFLSFSHSLSLCFVRTFSISDILNECRVREMIPKKIACNRLTFTITNFNKLRNGSAHTHRVHGLYFYQKYERSTTWRCTRMFHTNCFSHKNIHFSYIHVFIFNSFYTPEINEMVSIYKLFHRLIRRWRCRQCSTVLCTRLHVSQQLH